MFILLCNDFSHHFLNLLFCQHTIITGYDNAVCINEIGAWTGLNRIQIIDASGFIQCQRECEIKVIAEVADCFPCIIKGARQLKISHKMTFEYAVC